MDLHSQFGPVFHSNLHNAETESKVSPNHRIVLTKETSRRILLLAEKKR